MRDHLTSLRMELSSNNKNNVGEYVEKLETYVLMVGMQTGTAATVNSTVV